MPYRPTYTISQRLLARVEAVAALRERIVSASVEVPWIPALQKDTRTRNAHASTAIEGNPLTLEQVREVEEGRELAVGAREKREVVNYFAALRHVEKNAERRPIAHTDVHRLHRILAEGVMDQGESGRYRTIGVQVGKYVPPAAHQIYALMGELLDWWNQESDGCTPVISSAIVHYRFEAIHPYADGNGRTGRALALWELFRRGFDSHHIFSVDEYYWEDRPRYYAALEAVRKEREDLTSWLEYCAEGLRVTLEKTWRRIQQLSAKTRGAKLVLRPRQEQLLQILRARGAMTPRELWEALGVSKQGAMDLLRPLLAAKIVKREGTLKSGKYVLA